MTRNVSKRLNNLSSVLQLVNNTQVSSVQPSISEDKKTFLDLIETAKQGKQCTLPPTPNLTSCCSLIKKMILESDLRLEEELK